MHIYVVGSGKLAQAIQSAASLKKAPISTWNPELPTAQDGILFHAGSGREIEQALFWCKQHGVPFVQAATGQRNLLPDPAPCPIIVAPNLSLPLVTFMERIIPACRALKDQGMDTSIEESHQATKTSIADTARIIAGSLSMDPSEIKSIRNKEDIHAHHKINFTDSEAGVRISITAEVSGNAAYGTGALAIAEVLNNKRGILTARYYPLVEILEM